VCVRLTSGIVPNHLLAAIICTGVFIIPNAITFVIEKLAVSSGPANLHDTRSDHCYFIVPYPSIHTKSAAHTFKRGGITTSLKEPKSVTIHHQYLNTTK
jgi:hypothetical protein